MGGVVVVGVVGVVGDVAPPPVAGVVVVGAAVPPPVVAGGVGVVGVVGAAVPPPVVGVVGVGAGGLTGGAGASSKISFTKASSGSLGGMMTFSISLTTMTTVSGLMSAASCGSSGLMTTGRGLGAGVGAGVGFEPPPNSVRNKLPMASKNFFITCYFLFAEVKMRFQLMPLAILPSRVENHINKGLPTTWSSGT